MSANAALSATRIRRQGRRLRACRGACWARDPKLAVLSSSRATEGRRPRVIQKDVLGHDKVAPRKSTGQHRDPISPAPTMINMAVAVITERFRDIVLRLLGRRCADH